MNIIEEKENLKNRLAKIHGGGIRKADKELLIQFTSFLPIETSIGERRFYLIHNFTEIQTCPICGKRLGYNESLHKLNSFCSKECGSTKEGQKITIERREKSCEEKYGVKSFFQLDIFKEKAKQTCLKKYGEEYASRSNSVKEKTKKTNIKRYGCESHNQNKTIKEKKKKTYIEKYGVENPSQLNSVKEKKKSTCKEHYGVEIPLRSEEVKKRSKRTCLERYGTENPFQNKNVQEKYRLTYLEKYGSEPNFSSKAEQEIYDWLISIGITNIERNKRDWDSERVFEADLYLPDYKLVIEYNGLYWHSNLNKKDDYHFNKWKYFKEQNIDCIQIFENEWKEKKEIVKSILRNRLKKLTVYISSSECVVKELDSQLYDNFIFCNSFIKNGDSEIKLGLFYGCELVEVLSLNTTGDEQWKIVADVTKLNYEVENGFKSLLTHFSNNHHGEIIVNDDSRFENGQKLIENNFSFSHHSSPNYYIFNSNECLFKCSEKPSDNANIKFWICDCGDDIYSLVV